MINPKISKSRNSYNSHTRAKVIDYCINNKIISEIIIQNQTKYINYNNLETTTTLFIFIAGVIEEILFADEVLLSKEAEHFEAFFRIRLKAVNEGLEREWFFA